MNDREIHCSYRIKQSKYKLIHLSESFYTFDNYVMLKGKSCKRKLIQRMSNTTIANRITENRGFIVVLRFDNHGISFSGICEIRAVGGFLKKKCDSTGPMMLPSYKCAHSDEYYSILPPIASQGNRPFFNISCSNDTYGYQVSF